MAGESKGWICLYRNIQEHWLWQEKPFNKGQAWLDLLLSANHQDKKIMFDGNLIDVKRGQFITSIRKLCDKWGWSNTKVKKFLELCQADGMLTYKSDTKKTTINIENYSVYQNVNITKNVTETPQKHHRNVTETSQKHTNNNDNNENNNNSSSGYTKDDFEVFKHFEKCNFGVLSPLILEKIKADIEIYSKEWVKEAAEISDKQGKHNYNYVKGILTNWKASGKTDKADKKAATKPSWYKPDPFIDREQKQYDIDSIEKTLLGWDR